MLPEFAASLPALAGLCQPAAGGAASLLIPARERDQPLSCGRSPGGISTVEGLARRLYHPRSCLSQTWIRGPRLTLRKTFCPA